MYVERKKKQDGGGGRRREVEAGMEWMVGDMSVLEEDEMREESNKIFWEGTRSSVSQGFEKYLDINNHPHWWR